MKKLLDINIKTFALQETIKKHMSRKYLQADTQKRAHAQNTGLPQ